jgi:hypothetical protein
MKSSNKSSGPSRLAEEELRQPARLHADPSPPREEDPPADRGGEARVRGQPEDEAQLQGVAVHRQEETGDRTTGSDLRSARIRDEYTSVDLI